MYLPDGTDVCGLRDGEFERIGSVRGMKVAKLCSDEALLIHFCCGMFHLATVHFVTERHANK